MSIVIYAKRMEDLPVISKIGDIIRVHRANLVTYKDQKQCNVNVFYNSSWCLFSNEEDFKEETTIQEDKKKNKEEGGEEDEMDDEELSKALYIPYKFSGKNFSFNKEEVDIISGIRSFSWALFSKDLVMPDVMSTHLNQVREISAERNDFDLLVKVLKVIQKDDHNYQVRVKDVSKEAWTMTVSSLRYPILKEGDIIRIRSASVDMEADENVL